MVESVNFSALSINPSVAIIDGVFDQKTAAEIIALGQDDLSRSKVVLGSLAIETEQRTNSQAIVDQWAHPVLTDLATKISSFVRLPPEHSESAKLLHYQGDQKFDPHYDGYDADLGQSENLANGGQRVFTTLCYLNDVPNGGETVFPALKLAVRPKIGRILLFSNTIPGSNNPHPHSIHAGRPLDGGGEKWVLSIWWRERIYHVPREYPENSGATRVY